ncbi:MAG TPA: MFS transporter [Candidatus Dormibacteraeota bacterium]
MFGVREAAWPSIRTELGFSYASIGLLLTLPNLVSAVLEPAIALASGSGRRPAIIAAGGAAFTVALVLFAVAGNFGLLLVAFVILYPASGAFVSLSQATLMDSDPARHETNMARWVLAGSVGVVVGPLLFAGAVGLGLGWRPLFLLCAIASVPLAIRSRVAHSVPTTRDPTFRASLRSTARALRDRRVIRWLVLLELTNLLGDVLAGFLALYFVDVVHVHVGEAAFAIVVWAVAGLAGDALLVPLLNRVSGLTYLRVSGLATCLAYPAFLLVPSVPVKLVLLGAIGLLHAGWYAIPQGRLYSELHENSNVALAVSNVAGLVGGSFPLILGVAAEQWGLLSAMWVCALAPVALLIGLATGTGDTARQHWLPVE